MIIITWKDGTRWVLPTRTSPPRNFRILYRARRRQQARYARRINR